MEADLKLRGMASTIVAALFVSDDMFVVNVGDSEAFLLTDGEVTRLTVSDTPRDNVGPRGFRSSTLTQYLGGDAESGDPVVHVHRADTGPGQRLLLCSDGLTSALPMAEIEDLLTHGSGAAAVSTLLAQSLEWGETDDITIVLLERA